ncbi:hypothetical protein K439DRAFT_1345968 [Ramaria rubella]|nr:hypothetical protein K439DRAFT_1345968 [Ramaria rubella]
MHIEFLPPYSPDYNPIELAFLTIKAHIKREGEIARETWELSEETDVYICLIDAVFSVTAEDACAFFQKCGYD